MVTKVFPVLLRSLVCQFNQRNQAHHNRQYTKGNCKEPLAKVEGFFQSQSLSTLTHFIHMSFVAAQNSQRTGSALVSVKMEPQASPSCPHKVFPSQTNLARKIRVPAFFSQSQPVSPMSTSHSSSLPPTGAPSWDSQWSLLPGSLEKPLRQTRPSELSSLSHVPVPPTPCNEKGTDPRTGTQLKKGGPPGGAATSANTVRTTGMMPFSGVSTCTGSYLGLRPTSSSTLSTLSRPTSLEERSGLGKLSRPGPSQFSATKCFTQLSRFVQTPEGTFISVTDAEMKEFLFGDEIPTKFQPCQLQKRMSKVTEQKSEILDHLHAQMSEVEIFTENQSQQVSDFSLEFSSELPKVLPVQPVACSAAYSPIEIYVPVSSSSSTSLESSPGFLQPNLGFGSQFSSTPAVFCPNQQSKCSSQGGNSHCSSPVSISFTSEPVSPFTPRGGGFIFWRIVEVQLSSRVPSWNIQRPAESLNLFQHVQQFYLVPQASRSPFLYPEK